MYVLIACECSQKVCAAFRKRGHQAFSCDLQESYGGHPEWHIQSDCRMAIKNKWMYTEDGKRNYIPKWDIIIRHPPCTYFSRAGASIQPYQFGEPYTKQTYLWLIKLRPLMGTYECSDRTEWTTPQKGSNKNKAKKRSETFKGIAERMAQQWG